MSNLLSGARRRLSLALLLALAAFAGSGGSAFAQAPDTPAPTGNYNFTFGADGSSGLLHVVNGIVTAISGHAYDFANNTNQTIGGLLAPGSFTTPYYGDSTNDNELFINNGNLSGGGIAYVVNGNRQKFAAFGYNASADLSSTGGELGYFVIAANPAPAPTPGSGSLSWLVAAFGLGAYALWIRLQRRRRLGANLSPT